MTIHDRIAELWRLEKTTPRTEPSRDIDPSTGGASPWKVYRRQARKCTVCQSREIVRDGMYFCAAHHPDAKAVAA